MLFEKLYGFGEYRADVRLGQLCVMFGNAHRKKGARQFQLADFVPELSQPGIRRQQSAAEQFSVLRDFAAAWRASRGGEGKRKPRGLEPPRNPAARRDQ